MVDLPATEDQSMDLADFVEQSIVQVIKGAKSALDRVKDIDPSAVVNPRIQNAYFTNPEKLAFDIAVSVSGKKSGEGGVSIKVLSFLNAGGKGSVNQERELINRVRFEIPIAFPSTAKEQYNTAWIEADS